MLDILALVWYNMSISAKGGFAMPIVNRLEQVILDFAAQRGRRLPVSEIVKATGLAESTISRFAAGKNRRLDYSTLEALCTFLECQPGDLLVYIPGYKLSPQDKLALAQALLNEYLLDGTTGMEGENHVFIGRIEGLLFGLASVNVSGLKGCSVHYLLHGDEDDNIVGFRDSLDDVWAEVPPYDYFENDEQEAKFVELLADALPDYLDISRWWKPGW